eukprot:16001-Heterococcus_DN1.PRE.2
MQCCCYYCCKTAIIALQHCIQNISTLCDGTCASKTTPYATGATTATSNYTTAAAAAATFKEEYTAKDALTLLLLTPQHTTAVLTAVTTAVAEPTCTRHMRHVALHIQVAN